MLYFNFVLYFKQIAKDLWVYRMEEFQTLSYLPQIIINVCILEVVKVLI